MSECIKCEWKYLVESQVRAGEYWCYMFPEKVDGCAQFQPLDDKRLCDILTALTSERDTLIKERAELLTDNADVRTELRIAKKALEMFGADGGVNPEYYIKLATEE